MRLRAVRYLSICVLALLAMSSCRHARPGAKEQEFVTPPEPFFTSYNIRYERAETVWGANYDRGAILPAGTPVLRYGKGVGSRKMPVVVFETGGSAPGRFTLYWEPTLHPGVSVDDSIHRLFTPKDFGQLTQGLSATGIENIKVATATAGMSKRAVLLSRGYPPENRTPSLDGAEWIYATDRFRSERLTFGSRGLLQSKDSEQAASRRR